ncbi:MAG: HD domain-containing protein [Oligoflexales bacterium]|nr:HD domain-containing protein [Oligoflexales bacterium]
MALTIRRRIRGNILGSVDISLLEDKVIAHRFFQRLRRIRQTAFLSYVFPGATHTRFEHSLGVMHQADLAWHKMRDNQSRLREASRKDPHFSQNEISGTYQKHEAKQTPIQISGLLSPTFELIDKIFSSDYTLQCLRLAALCHDLGHPPFSHGGERFFMPSLKQVLEGNSYLPPYLKSYLEQEIQKQESSYPKKTYARHEIFTVLLIDKVLQDIYEKNPEISLKPSAQDLASIIIPSIEPQADSELISLGVHQICHELLSGDIDIDRMDYLRRDSQECGVTYGLFDSDRILNSLAIYFKPEDKRLHLALDGSGLAAYENYLLARQTMYAQLYFHKTSVACEAMLQRIARLLKGWTLPANVHEYVAVDEFSIRDRLLTAGQVVFHKAEEFKSFQELVDDLLLNRKLWKRAFEHRSSHPGPHLELEQAKTSLSEKGSIYEEILSKSVRGSSGGNLQLIKKSEQELPFVETLHTQLQTDDRHPSLFISSLYIPRP